MDKQSKYLISACVVALLFAGVIGLAAFTRMPEFDQSPFIEPTPDQPDQIDLILTPPTETATPEHIADAGKTINEIEEEWSLCDPRHNATHLQYWGCWGGSGGSSGSSPQAPVHPIPELWTAGLISLGIIAIFIARRQS